MKILLIRLMGLGDVASILVPTAYIYRQLYPSASITALSYEAGNEIMRLELGDTRRVCSEAGQGCKGEDWRRCQGTPTATHVHGALAITGLHWQAASCHGADFKRRSVRG